MYEKRSKNGINGKSSRKIISCHGTKSYKRIKYANQLPRCYLTKDDSWHTYLVPFVFYLYVCQVSHCIKFIIIWFFLYLLSITINIYFYFSKDVFRKKERAAVLFISSNSFYLNMCNVNIFCPSQDI